MITIIVIASLTIITSSQKLIFHSPQQLVKLFPQGLDIKISPIGYQPKSGQLDGTIMKSQPFDACSPIDYVENQNQDVFVLVNDLVCLESVKAKNIVSGGGILGLMKQNIENSLHDKDFSIVHIPIVEIKPQDFDALDQYITKQSQINSPSISASIYFFSQNKSLHDISTQIWFSPTSISTYKFIINMEQFLNNQKNSVQFTPRYAIHSQKDRKTFIGCYSNGRYCPGEIQFDGIVEGQNIMAQTLRQIVIRDFLGMEAWWKYIKNYYVQCLKSSSEDDFMMSSKQLQTCTRNAMMLSGIDYNVVQNQIGLSFLGPRKQVDDNILLSEQRQDYIRQKITSFPIMLINQKQYDLSSTTLNYQNDIKISICKIQHTRSKQCSQLIDGKLQDGDLMIIVGIVLIIIILVLVVYKVIMYKKMEKEMKYEVTSTLEQYYRYMQTLGGENQGKESNNKGVYNKQKPESLNSMENQYKKQKRFENNYEIENSQNFKEIEMTGHVKF